MTGVRHNLPGRDEARALGAAMVAVSIDLLKQLPGVRRRWWKGGEPYLDVTVDEDDAGCVYVEVCLRGRFVRRRRGGALETGHSDELELAGGGMPRAPGNRRRHCGRRLNFARHAKRILLREQEGVRALDRLLHFAGHAARGLELARA